MNGYGPSLRDQGYSPSDVGDLDIERAEASRLQRIGSSPVPFAAWATPCGPLPTTCTTPCYAFLTARTARPSLALPASLGWQQRAAWLVGLG
jgi:hypothetical protein